MKTVSTEFKKLLDSVQPTGGEITAATKHFATIKTRLESVFAMNKFQFIGSFSRNTFISGHSDVDILAQISLDEIRWGDKLKSSYTVLEHFRKEIKSRLPYSTVRRDVHAIVVEFSDLDIDVVPAAWEVFSPVHKRPFFLIPDGEGGWMRTCPDVHNTYLINKNTESRSKMRGVTQLFKHWLISRSTPVPISSFHAEMVLASEGICTGVKSYAECMTELLQSLAARNCVGIRDPMGISGNISATRTQAQRESALATVRRARDHAKAALQAESQGRMTEALNQWDYAFEYKFLR